MKRTNIKYFRKKNIILHIVENYKLLLFCLTFILGLIIGAVVVKNSDGNIISLLSDTFNSYVSNRTGQTVIKTFLYSLTSLLPYILAAFISGICVIGVVFVPFITFIRGLGIGLTLGFLYSAYGLKGIAFSVLLIVPFSLISVFALILACRESFGFSAQLLHLISPKGDSVNLSSDFRLYCYRYIFIFVIIIFSSLLDSILSFAFMRFFTF